MSGCDDQLGPEPKRSKAAYSSREGHVGAVAGEKRVSGEGVTGLPRGVYVISSSSNSSGAELMAIESNEERQRRQQRELRAAAAERRMSTGSEQLINFSSPLAFPSASPLVAPSATHGLQGPLFSSPPTAESEGDPAFVVGRGGGNANVPYQQPISSPDSLRAVESGGENYMQKPAAVPGDGVRGGSGQMGSGGGGVGQSGGSGKSGPGGGGDPMEGQLSVVVAKKLYRIVFGTNTSPEVLTQWCRQGFNFSSDPETSMGLVQLEGGPCGVLAPIQALVLKYLIFVKEDEEDCGIDWGRSDREFHARSAQGLDGELQFSEWERNRALVRAIGEALLQAGQGRRAVVAFLRPGVEDSEMRVDDDGDGSDNRGVIWEGRDVLPLKSAEVLHELVRVRHCRSTFELHRFLLERLNALKSGFGALLVLFSALLSRALDGVQSDRDDPDHPLITPPFGHASQEVVNLLLCGHAVANVFDGSINMGGGICLNGVPADVQVGFLTLLESLNLCKVGQNLKTPQWPVWVLGSESHYTVLFALSTSVQEESEAEDREARVRRVFDSLDMSGGGGFISAEVLNQLLQAANVDMPDNMRASLAGGGIIVWQDFWKALCLLPKSKGGFAGTGVGGTTQKRRFTLFHFNGIAKSVNGGPVGGGIVVGGGKDGAAGGESGCCAMQKPRLTRLHVVVPPKWTCESSLAEELEAAVASGGGGEAERRGNGDGGVQAERTADIAAEEVEEIPPEEMGTAGQAPLVDCIRTRWPRAVCYWMGDPPSIV